MSKNHTSGPWLIDADDMQQDEDTVFSIGIWSGQGEGRSMVAHISAFGLHSETHGDVVVHSPMAAEQSEIDEAKANARLVAAAPLLLDALRQWAAAERDGDAEELSNAKAARDAAIAAATN